MIPVLAICDPEITIGLPKSLTCGMRCRRFNTLYRSVYGSVTSADHRCSGAERDFYDRRESGKSIRERRRQRSKKKHDDRKYDRRYGVHFFKCRSGTCFCRDSSAWFDTPHGVANSLFLPYIMEFNIPACPERFADIADAWESKEKKYV